ncbi:unnamed protein product [Urochloa humidicola]
MAPRQQQQQQPLLPSFLYAPAASGASGRGTAAVMAGAPSEPFGKIEMFTPAYYTAAAVAGAAACGFTHTAVTPLDVIKCNIQIDPAKYKSTSSAFGVVMREQGIRGFFRGWAPTFSGGGREGLRGAWHPPTLHKSPYVLPCSI